MVLEETAEHIGPYSSIEDHIAYPDDLLEQSAHHRNVLRRHLGFTIIFPESDARKHWGKPGDDEVAVFEFGLPARPG